MWMALTLNTRDGKSTGGAPQRHGNISLANQ